MKHQRFKRFSLPAQLFVFVAGTVVFVAVALLILSTSLISDVIHSKAETSMRRELELVVSNFQSLTSGVDDFSITFSIDSGIQSILRSYPQFPSDAAQSYNVRSSLTRNLTYLGAGSTAFASVDVLFQDGQLAHVSEFSPLSALEALDLDAVEQTRVTCHPVWTAPQMLRGNTSQDKSVFTVYKSVYDLDRFVYLGTVVLYVNEQSFADVLRTAASGHTNFYLLSGDQVLSSAVSAEAYRSFGEVIGVNDPAFSAQSLENGQIVSCSGGNQIFYRQPLGIEDWYVVSTMPTAYLNAEINSLTAIILLVTLAALILTSIGAAVLAHRILRPVERLQHSVEAIPLRDGVQLLPQEAAAEPSHITSQNLDLMTEKIRQLMEQLYADQKQRNKLHFRVMQEQIKPHFLYNSLETAASLISLGLEEDAGAYVHHLSTFYRLSLSAGQDVIPLSQELRLTEAYLQIQKTRYCEFFDYTLEVDDAVGSFPIPKLTLQPIVENSIYHGLKPKCRKGMIRISARVDGGTARITIYDDGVGMSPEQVTALLQGPRPSADGSGSFGLANVIDRLRIISGGQARLKIASELGSYTQFTLLLPGGECHENSRFH